MSVGVHHLLECMGDGMEVQEPGPPPLLPFVSDRDQHLQNTATDPANPDIGQHGLVQSMAQLMQAQTNMLTAHAQAVAMQNLRVIPPFTGEDPKGDEDNFEKWLELLEERGRIARWSKEQYLCQLRTHLTQTAQQIFRMLSEEERKSYDLAVTALKKRFRPIDIEELRGLDFHQKMQDSETIEQLGIDLQSLARRAFPELRGGKEFDRLLKGRFFQALLPKWQRKLGAPKPEESFAELYDRARMLEKREVQYSDSANVRKDTKATATPTDQKSDQNKKNQQGKYKFQKSYKAPTQTTTSKEGNVSAGPAQSAPGQKSVGTNKTCFRCKSPSHWAKDCTKQLKAEAPGRGKPSSTTSMITPVSTLEQMTDEQLEDILSKRKLEREQELLKEVAQVDVVRAEEGSSGAVGPILSLKIKIEGVDVDAMVDTGSQSTVISRSMLHRIGKHLRSQGKEFPTLNRPHLQLFGKGGKNDTNELNITAETLLTIEADGHQVSTSVFVQPGSEQLCLLGTNVILPLNLKFLKSNRDPLKTEMPKSAKSVKVSLIEATTIPARKGRFIEASLDQELPAGAEVVFEPKVNALQSYGLSSPESILSVNANGNLLIPLQNFRQNSTNLEAGMELGTIERFDGQIESPECKQSTCAHVTMQSKQKLVLAQSHNLTDRQTLLKSELKLSQQTLACEAKQVEQLEDLLLNSVDVFALNDSELGRTSLVKHSIDTGDHPPIKQQPCRTPFVQREKISKLIDEM